MKKLLLILIASSIISDAQDISTRIKARWSIAKEIDNYKEMHEKRERRFSSGCNALGIILGSAMMIHSIHYNYNRGLCCPAGCLIDTLACMSCCADIQLFRGDSQGFGSMTYDWCTDWRKKHAKMKERYLDLYYPVDSSPPHQD